MVEYNCDNCGITAQTKRSEYLKNRRHFCSRKCYSIFREHQLPKEEQHAWQGGVTPAESRRRWREKHKEKMNAIKKARERREQEAPGSHTAAEWREVKEAYGNRCAEHDNYCRGPITKDHKTPLAFGGSQNKENLQPLCSRHNSRKSARVLLDFSKELS